MAKDANTQEQVVQDTKYKSMTNFMARAGQWKVGDIYAPHDLTGAETSKWRKRGNPTPTTDAFDTLALDPLKEYKVSQQPPAKSMPRSPMAVIYRTFQLWRTTCRNSDASSTVR